MLNILLLHPSRLPSCPIAGCAGKGSITLATLSCFSCASHMANFIVCVVVNTANLMRSSLLQGTNLQTRLMEHPDWVNEGGKIDPPCVWATPSQGEVKEKERQSCWVPHSPLSASWWWVRHAHLPTFLPIPRPSPLWQTEPPHCEPKPSFLPCGDQVW